MTIWLDESESSTQPIDTSGRQRCPRTFRKGKGSRRATESVTRRRRPQAHDEQRSACNSTFERSWVLKVKPAPASDTYSHRCIARIQESWTMASTTLRHHRPLHQCICWPPLIAILDPVTKPASSEHRYLTRAATSSGLPRRPAGICGRIFASRISCAIAVTIFVAR